MNACSSSPPPPPHHGEHGHRNHHGEHGEHGHHGAGHQPGYHGHRFDDAETWAKRFEGPERDAWQQPEKVLAFVALKPGQSLADVGAGTGYFSVRFARQPGASEVFAVDVEPSMVDYTSRRAQREQLPNLKAVLGTTEDPKIPAPVDVVFVCDTYHHIDNRTAYFQKLATSLKPGGRLVIVDFKKDSPEGPPPEARLTPEQIDQELAPAGLRRTQVDLSTLPRQYMLTYSR